MIESDAITEEPNSINSAIQALQDYLTQMHHPVLLDGRSEVIRVR